VATSSAPVAYLDCSALVKLIAREPETSAPRHELVRWPRRVSSLLAAIEVTRTARRLGARATPLAPGPLAALQLLAIDPIAPIAMRIGGTMLRSLDPIHRATAASISGDLGALITYERRMITDARRSAYQRSRRRNGSRAPRAALGPPYGRPRPPDRTATTRLPRFRDPSPTRCAPSSVHKRGASSCQATNPVATREASSSSGMFRAPARTSGSVANACSQLPG
jgi:hypothetical protein